MIFLYLTLILTVGVIVLSAPYGLSWLRDNDPDQTR